MANAVEDALNRMNADQRAQVNQTIEEARRNIQTAELQAAHSPSSDAATIIARNQQVIDEARRSIPIETMKSVDEVSSPMTTPPMHGNINPEPIELHPDMQADIESVQQTGGNNYLNENAVDRAMARPSQEPIQQQNQQQELGR